MSQDGALLEYVQRKYGCVFSSYTTDEIHFNLMALIADRKKLYEKQIEECGEKRDTAAQRVCGWVCGSVAVQRVMFPARSRL